ncbi:gamma-glutamyl-gamma-aminobutyrate hydrolase family protein [Crenobacter cavernae]|uniref:gamma-glutamyl-gamma-aminobutyrate hydrolase n=1 Tax=Crenobacter cavernae TaxID=2290923 RepID=A0A345YA89_9NEIS|nr:gamma-glutamyl-gamma-aminobutyrate hydrolase family protein [Crenobacter cavernae]AXK40841.1 gamma-glutamyl-gamma-aminobutyrate hydrolase family protein [Crenobacter cavernae]
MKRPVIGIPCCRWWLKESQFFHLVGEKYIRAAEGAGGLPLLLPALGESTPIEQLLDTVDGLLFTGSPSNIEPHHYGAASVDGDFNDPQRDATTLPLVRAAIDAGIPVLGICRGFQEINVALGGSLHAKVHEVPGMNDHRDPGGTLEEMYALAHPVSFAEGGVLHRLAGQLEAQVNSLHGQGVATLALALQAEAYAPDGLVEAFSVKEARAFALAVQWHPEWQYQDNPLSLAILEAFGEACSARKAARHTHPSN